MKLVVFSYFSLVLGLGLGLKFNRKVQSYFYGFTFLLIWLFE